MCQENTFFPPFFHRLIQWGCLSDHQIRQTADAFFAAGFPLSGILASRDITTFPNDNDQLRQCDRFFDDWYLYAVSESGTWVYSLFKMREQEDDAGGAIPADGDTPGVTVSFIAFDTDILSRCLEDPSHENRKAMNREIDRVVAAPNQSHHKILKAYFSAPEAQAPYLIAKLYTAKIASLAIGGAVAVPAHYAALCGQADWQKLRLPAFIEENNRAAGKVVCDHEKIYIRDPADLSLHEMQAILATHTGNVSFHSFAAEVRYHALFLVGLAKLTIPGIGRSPYASAIRADMSIGDTEMQGFTPYYDLDSSLVRLQEKHHPDQP